MELGPVYYFVLVSLHWMIRLYNFARLNFWQTWQRIFTKDPTLEDLVTLRCSLGKTPSHLAYCVDSEATSMDLPKHVNALAKLISWSWAMGCKIVTIYDTFDQIGENSDELELQVEKYIARLRRPVLKMPPVQIKFYNSWNRFLGLDKIFVGDKLHVLVVSPQDGKQRVADALKTLITRSEAANVQTKDNLVSEDERKYPKGDEKKIELTITETKFNEAIAVVSEPQLLIVTGSSSSTLGFLPWEIRLTEIDWIRTFPFFSQRDFSKIFERFASCDQKIGK